MSEMVKHVADALAQSFRDTVARVSGESWEETGVTLPSKEVFERYARAAIAAMRDPTARMIYVGEGYCDFVLPPGLDNTGDGRRKEFRMGWQAAIDEALK